MTLTPFWKAAANGLTGVLVSQLALCVQVLIWVLVTFRSGNLRGLGGTAAARLKQMRMGIL